jgi:Holliday junction resolvase
MTHPSARKGSTFERALVAYLQEHGFPYAERAYGAGRPADVGDIDGLPGIVLEAKACRALELAAWVDEAERERLNARADYSIVVAKRRNKPTADAYAVLPLWQLVRLLRERNGHT